MILERFDALARRPRAAALAVFAVPLLAGLGYLAAHGAPQPIVHDEFSYLLAADTFARGRLSNPEPPVWRAFQSVNVLVRPSYMSKYPPGQGLFLALGALAGVPLLGAILCVALASAAIYWMLRAFVEPRWALFGGLLAASHPLLLLWLTHFWGGGVALLGGALAMGAVKRALDRPRAAWGFALAAGLALLANSRPLEGLVFALPLLAALAWRRRSECLVLLGPMLAVLAGVGAWMALYNYRVTGSPWTLPYLVYERTYNQAPLFIWQKHLREIAASGVPEIDRLWAEWNLDGYRRQQTWGGFFDELMGRKLVDLDQAWLSPLPVKLFLVLPLLGPCGPLFLSLGAVLAGATALVLTQLFYFPHYSAPLGGLFFLLVTAGMRRACAFRWRGAPLGKLFVAGTTLLCLARSAAFCARKAESPRKAWSYYRDEAREKLRTLGGKHLVLVRYGPDASYHWDWTANGADLEGAPVVWAWDLGEDEDSALEEHYADRTIWRLTAQPPRPLFEMIRAPQSAGR